MKLDRGAPSDRLLLSMRRSLAGYTSLFSALLETSHDTKNEVSCRNAFLFCSFGMNQHRDTTKVWIPKSSCEMLRSLLVLPDTSSEIKPGQRNNQQKQLRQPTLVLVLCDRHNLLQENSMQYIQIECANCSFRTNY